MVDPEVVVRLEFGALRISFWALKSLCGGKLTLARVGSSHIGKIGDVSRTERFCVTGGNAATSCILHSDDSLELNLLLYGDN